jgi:hypothetical protein
MKTRMPNIISAIVAILFFALIIGLRADTVTVTNTNDSGPGSLRQALADVNDGDTIDFAVTGTIGLTSGELLVDKNITISGPGTDNLTVDGNDENRVFYVGPAVFVTISNLTITNGNVPTNYGGGVYNDHSDLTMNTCRVSDNSAFWGGGMYNDGSLGRGTVLLNNSAFSNNSAFQGGGIFNKGENSGSTTATLNNCAFSDNSTSFDGAGIYNFGPAGNAIVTVNNSTFNGNSAGTGGGAGGGGIYNEGSTGSATVTLNNSTFSSNSTSADGGGIYNDGSTVTVSNSTFSSNSSLVAGGAIYNNSSGGGSTLTLSNSTLSNNSADAAGGSIYNESFAFGTALVNIGGTILNAAAGGNIFNNGSGKIISQGYNLSNDDAGGFLTGPGDQINTDPLLGPLQDNGGPTLTHEILNGSAAIDAGDPKFAPPPFYDQRGPDFFRVRNGRTDIGSFEAQVGSTPTPTPRPAPTPRPRRAPHPRPTPP